MNDQNTLKIIFFSFSFMLPLFAVISVAASNKNDVFSTFVRPEYSPLEIYPTSRVPLCISSPMPGFDPMVLHKCKCRIMTASKPPTASAKPWCTTSLTNNTRELLEEQLYNKYELSFTGGERSAYTSLGPNNYSVFSHFLFTFYDSNDQLSLIKVTGSEPVNITQNAIQFVYETKIVNTMYPVHYHPTLFRYMIAIIFLLIVFGIFIFNPDLINKSPMTVLSTIPSHNFLIVVVCGAGCGVFMFVFSIIVMSCLGITWYNSWGLGFVVPSALSSITTGIVTSIVAAYCHLKDLASALYFAPLLIPSIALAIFFSVQWIPICVESCLTLPARILIIFIVTVVFVKLPLNLISGLLTATIFKIPSYHSLTSITARKIISSRRIFLTFANCIMFFIMFPMAQHVMKTYHHGLDEYDWHLMLFFLPIWVLTSALIGISSIPLSDAVDWANFAFVSASGSGLIMWIVFLFSGLFAEKMKGTLQMSMNASITLIVSIVLSFTSGGISSLAAVIWLGVKGTPAKSS